MDQRISLITLGVRDMDRTAAFYDALGWRQQETPDGMVVYDLPGQSLGLYPLENLARDLGIPVDRLGHGAMTLSHNVRDKADVATTIDAMRAAGGEVLREAHDIFWGGHIGYVADPEGHVWEVCWNPHAPLAPDGSFRWTGFGEPS